LTFPVSSVLHENDGGGMKPAKCFRASAARRPKAAISGVFNAQIQAASHEAQIPP
jgi:hypothetical protein